MRPIMWFLQMSNMISSVKGNKWEICQLMSGSSNDMWVNGWVIQWFFMYSYEIKCFICFPYISNHCVDFKQQSINAQAIKLYYSLWHPCWILDLHKNSKLWWKSTKSTFLWIFFTYTLCLIQYFQKRMLTFWCDVCLFLEHSKLDVYSDSSSCRHITQISTLYWLRVNLSFLLLTFFFVLRLIGEVANTNVIVVVLSWPNTEPTIFCTKSEYIKYWWCYEIITYMYCQTNTI